MPEALATSAAELKELVARNPQFLVDELELGYGLFAHDPAANVHRVPVDRTHPRVVDASVGDEALAGARGNPVSPPPCADPVPTRRARRHTYALIGHTATARNYVGRACH